METNYNIKISGSGTKGEILSTLREHLGSLDVTPDNKFDNIRWEDHILCTEVSEGDPDRKLQIDVYRISTGKFLGARITNYPVHAMGEALRDNSSEINKLVDEVCAVFGVKGDDRMFKTKLVD